MTAWPGLRAAEPLEWMRTIRDGVDLSKSTKSVAFCLALYANVDTCDAYPGWKRLAWGSGCSKRTVLSALADLKGFGLLYCVERGSRFGTRNMASKYTLTLHDKLEVVTTSYERWLELNDLGGSEAPARPSKVGPAEDADPFGSTGGDPWAALSTTHFGPGAAIAHGAAIAPAYPEPGAKT